MSSYRWRYSGFAHPDDVFHTLKTSPVDEKFGAWTASIRVDGIFKPKDKRLQQATPIEVPGGQVLQWAPPIRSKVNGFNPAGDCDGYFTSSKYQPNNNCYNYACNVASNSFAHPGRRAGMPLVTAKNRVSASLVIAAAAKDGLVEIGRADMKLRNALKEIKQEQKRKILGEGHLVALFISKTKKEIEWAGDFHWVRCDDPSGQSWSQKDGPDQVTNFDFAGNWITDPQHGNWVVNQGPQNDSPALAKQGSSAIQTVYEFAAWMFVPYLKVDLI